MQRVLVIGPCGAGKSVLSRRLGELLGLPLIHLDALNWMPGWVSTPDDQWRQKVIEATNRPRWVMDGNYIGSLDLRLSAADMVVFLDMPRWLCLWRILKRIVRYHGQTRPDMGCGCPERLDWEFIEYCWDFPEHSRPKILRSLARHDRGRSVIVLRTPAQVDQFVEQVRQQCQPA